MKYQKYLGLAIVGILAVGAVALIAGGNDHVERCSEAFKSIDNSGIEDWRNFELVDVNSCETYSISSLDKPVLIETFAVWCPTCTRQQQEVKEFHKDSEVTSVSLDTDQNEDALKVRKHTQEHGFNWRYSVIPIEMTRDMVQEFDSSIANPPTAPMVLLCEDGVRKLPNGVKPVSKLQQEVEKGC